MKRNFLLVCVSALVLALGLSTSAAAGLSAEISAKPAKKGKSCKKKGGKGKAGKSTAATAQAKKKGKSKPCKAKGTAPPAAAPLDDGTYGDAAAHLELSVSGGTSTVTLKYTPPGGCVGINYTSLPVTFTKSGATWTANETRAYNFVGDPANVKWDLTVKEPGLTYALNFTFESNSMIGFCKWEGHPTGTLAKVG